MGCTTSEPRCQGMEHILQLYTAIHKNNYMEARQLIATGANVNCINYTGGTPLIETCRTPLLHKKERERESFVLFLISNGAEVDLSDIFGGTAIIYAKHNGLQSIVSMLKGKDRRDTGKEKIYSKDSSYGVLRHFQEYLRYIVGVILLVVEPGRNL